MSWGPSFAADVAFTFEVVKSTGILGISKIPKHIQGASDVATCRVSIYKHILDRKEISWLVNLPPPNVPPP